MNAKQTIGFLDEVSDDRIAGWGFRPGREHPATVILMMDGVEIQRTLADQFRADLVALNVHPTGMCGYEFLPNTFHGHLPERATVEIRFENVEGPQPVNSPWFHYSEAYVEQFREKLSRRTVNASSILVVGCRKVEPACSLIAFGSR